MTKKRGHIEKRSNTEDEILQRLVVREERTNQQKNISVCDVGENQVSELSRRSILKSLSKVVEISSVLNSVDKITKMKTKN